MRVDDGSGIPYPKCEVCAILAKEGAQRAAGMWARLRRRSRLGEVPEATVVVTVSPVLEQYLGGRNRKTIKLCSKHSRLLIKSYDRMIGELVDAAKGKKYHLYTGREYD